MQSNRKKQSKDNSVLTLLEMPRFPAEVEILILQFLSFQQLAQVSSTTKRWFIFYQESAKTNKEQLLRELQDPLRHIQTPLEILKRRLAPHLHEYTPINDKKRFFVSLKNMETLIAFTHAVAMSVTETDILNVLGGIQIKVTQKDMKEFLQEKFGVVACINPLANITSLLEKDAFEMAQEIAVLSIFEKMLQSNNDDSLELINALFENNKQQKRFLFKNNQLIISGCGNGSFTLKNIKELAIKSCLGDVSTKDFNKLVEEEEKTVCKTLSLGYGDKDSTCVIS